jgi:TonB family protein
MYNTAMKQNGSDCGAGRLHKRSPLARWIPVAATLLLVIASAQAQIPPADDAMNKGVQAFRNGAYADAANYFKQAVTLNPKSVTARSYLATAYQMQYIPGAESGENTALAQAAQDEFLKVIELEPKNTAAMLSIATLYFHQRKTDEARDWYKEAIGLNPNEKTAHYTIGVIDWMAAFQPRMKARTEMGMRPEDPGPLKDANVRAALRSQNLPSIEEGITSLETALAMDPEYDDAMAYLNLLYRERADLQDSEDAWRSDTLLADQWVEKTLAMKRLKASREASEGGSPGCQTAPPPPPPPQAASETATEPRIIRGLGPEQMGRLLINRVDPVYPAQAQAAGISGTVRFNAIIGTDGRIKNLALVSGHPLLISAAQAAVRQWIYEPTLLGGEPVEVTTQIEVHFGFR